MMAKLAVHIRIDCINLFGIQRTSLPCGPGVVFQKLLHTTAKELSLVTKIFEIPLL